MTAHGTDSLPRLRATATLAILVVLVVVGCDSPTGAAAGRATFAPVAEERASWCLILAHGAGEALAPWVDEDLAELREAADGSTVAVASLRGIPSQAALTLWFGGRVVEVELADLAAEASTASAPVSEAELLLAAVSAVRLALGSPAVGLVLGGEGRGWRGIGATAHGEVRWTAATIAAVTTAVESPELLVLDGSFTAHVEVVAGLGVTTLVAARRGPAAPEGADYRALDLTALAPPTAGGPPAALSPDELATAWARVAGDASRPVVVRGVDVAAALARTGELAAALSMQIASATSQSHLAATLVEVGESQAVPGDHAIGLQSLALALGIEADPSIPDLLLHLTELDELARPRGNADSYREPWGAEAAPGWAPDPVTRSGALYHLWYRSF